MKDNINSLSFFKANFSKILANKDQTPFIITQNGKAAGVFLDIETWEALSRKMALMKMVQEGEESLQKEEVRPLAQVKEDMKAEYGL